jgi:lysozyme
MPKKKNLKDLLSENDLIAMEEIKAHEGFRSDEDGMFIPYEDSEGHLTIGYGHLVDEGEDYLDKMTSEQADELFVEDYIYHRNKASEMPGWDKATDRQKRGLVNLAFNMGPVWYKPDKEKGRKGFPNFNAAAKGGDWNTAADELVNSKWYGQVGNRAEDVVDLIRPMPPRTYEYRGGGLIRDAYGRTLI